MDVGADIDRELPRTALRAESYLLTRRRVSSLARVHAWGARQVSGSTRHSVDFTYGGIKQLEVQNQC